jgi:SAM-dependent methyltransferase
VASQDEWTLEAGYDAYPRIEEAFQHALDESLQPRGPEMLYDLVAGLDLPPRASVLDVGCGEGRQSLELARRFGVEVVGVDPVVRHIELSNEALAAAAGNDPSLTARVRFAIGAAESLPVGDATTDLVWCREVLVHVADLAGAFAEFRRVLRPGARVLVYQVFEAERLEPRESAQSGWTEGGKPERVEAAIAAAGLRIDECIVIGSEWGERAEEQSGQGTRRLLHAARLLRAPDRYIAQFGEMAYEIMLGDCLWHIYRMIGKLSGRVYLLSKP